MKKYKLSPLDIKELDENRADIAAIDHTLKIALQYHSNLMNILEKEKAEWWNRMAEKYNLDISNKIYKPVKIHGAIYIIEKED